MRSRALLAAVLLLATSGCGRNWYDHLRPPVKPAPCYVGCPILSDTP